VCGWEMGYGKSISHTVHRRRYGRLGTTLNVYFLYILLNTHVSTYYHSVLEEVKPTFCSAHWRKKNTNRKL
jgi:hypothetical protein